MQEDKKLQELIQQFAIEDVSTDFTQNIMQRIEAQETAKQTARPSINAKLLWAIAGGFVLVVAALLVLSGSDMTIVFPYYFTALLPAKYISQITSFLIVFWVVMLINLLYQSKNKLVV